MRRGREGGGEGGEGTGCEFFPIERREQAALPPTPTRSLFGALNTTSHFLLRAELAVPGCSEADH